MFVYFFVTSTSAKVPLNVQRVVHIAQSACGTAAGSSYEQCGLCHSSTCRCPCKVCFTSVHYIFTAWTVLPTREQSQHAADCEAEYAAVSGENCCLLCFHPAIAQGSIIMHSKNFLRCCIVIVHNKRLQGCGVVAAQQLQVCDIVLAGAAGG
jgi:hypothetical protein